MCKVMKRSLDKCFHWLINSSVKTFCRLKLFSSVPNISLSIDEFFIPKVCAKFSVIIKVNKGDFCEKKIQELNSTLFS